MSGQSLTSKKMDEYYRDLAAVCTLREAARLWQVSYTTLHTMCIYGRLVAVQPDGGKTWLVSTRHMRDLFGMPDLPDSPGEDLRSALVKEC